MEQLQCPNCGGYKVERPLDISGGMALFNVFMFFATVGLWLIVLELFINPALRSKPLKQGAKLTCELCGHKWAYDPDAEPVDNAQTHQINIAMADSPPPDIVELLRKLSDLKDSGVISEAEYEHKKQDLLDRL